MCGRFVQVSPFHVIAETFNVKADRAELRPRYNIVPGQNVFAVIRESGEDRNRIVELRWGLVPFWSKDPTIGNRMINARSESLSEKPSFRNAFRKQRCLIPAEGFYEWQRSEKTKRPFYIRLKSKRPFGLAGLYETWSSPGGELLKTCTIITTEANDLLRPLHDRMPVIVPAARQDAWLDPALQDGKSLLDILKPYPSVKMEFYEVSRAVNSPRNDSPDLIRPSSTGV